jgi:hypothetical protein
VDPRANLDVLEKRKYLEIFADKDVAQRRLVVTDVSG